MKIMWCITKDNVDTERELTASVHFNLGKKATKKLRKFRMYDDDDVLYFEGRGNCLDHEDGTGFEPLDDFGTPDAGCTRIDWCTEGDTWETL